MKTLSWAENISNYVDPSVDVRGYFQQPIEEDARTFADLVMKGVK